MTQKKNNITCQNVSHVNSLSTPSIQFHSSRYPFHTFPHLHSGRVEYITGEFIEMCEAGAVVVLSHHGAHLSGPTTKREVAKKV